jgi:hypothetical protein
MHEQMLNSLKILLRWGKILLRWGMRSWSPRPDWRRGEKAFAARLNYKRLSERLPRCGSRSIRELPLSGSSGSTDHFLENKWDAQLRL